MALELENHRVRNLNGVSIPPLRLSKYDARYALKMFRRGLDTLQIAAQLRTSEAEVYNALSRLREEIREGGAR